MNDLKSWEHDGDPIFIYDYLIECAKGWEPHARLLGNARAEDIVRALVRMKNSKDWHALRTSRLMELQRNMRDPERKMVCDILANGVTYETPASNAELPASRGTTTAQLVAMHLESEEP